MEGADHAVKYFLTEVFRLLRVRHKVFEDIPMEYLEPVDEVSSTLIENMSKVVFMHSFSSRSLWHPYLKNNLERWNASWKLYLQYTIYTYYCINDGIYEVNERLVSILSVAAITESFLCNRGYKEYLGDSIKILCKFFKKEVAKNFFVGGGWKSLQSYLLSHEYLTMYGEKRPISEAEVAITNDRLKGLLSKFMKNFVPESIQREEIENHEPTKTMVDCILQQP
ncbi:hypothetical protein JTE90_026334 [Oedothorax gibbosus]|uniref:Cullin N-terminal domain-containing protein n=1 Tax=Oedothorax gibbosus TaxID=931172 RepID=A0AAV6U648_9ARAC|nr:hypothetical protein JTE90_026334 [Oedothorax gibbosus]